MNYKSPFIDDVFVKKSATKRLMGKYIEKIYLYLKVDHPFFCQSVKKTCFILLYLIA